MVKALDLIVSLQDKGIINIDASINGGAEADLFAQGKLLLTQA